MRSKVCVPCLGSKIKKALADEFDSPHIQRILKNIPDCEDPEDIELCGKVERKEKRPRNAYQQHMSDCMKDKKIKGAGAAPEAMKGCAAEWRSRKVR